MEITFRERDVNRCANSYGEVVIPIIFLASLQMASRIYLTISKSDLLNTFSMAHVKSETVFLFGPGVKYTR